MAPSAAADGFRNALLGCKLLHTAEQRSTSIQAVQASLSDMPECCEWCSHRHHLLQASSSTCEGESTARSHHANHCISSERNRLKLMINIQHQVDDQMMIKPSHYPSLTALTEHRRTSNDVAGHPRRHCATGRTLAHMSCRQ